MNILLDRAEEPELCGGVSVKYLRVTWPWVD